MISHLKAEEQHQHSNGGGWVANTAKVHASAYVSDNAQVSGNAQVYGNAWVSGDAQVSGNAWVSGDAQVSGNAQVYGNAQVSGNAQVYGNARVSGDAWVSGDAQVYGNAWVLNPLTATGSKHVICLVSYTQIAIGCKVHTIVEWLKNYKAIGKANNYTAEQIAEYGELLKYLAKAAKTYVKRNKKEIKETL